MAIPKKFQHAWRSILFLVSLITIAFFLTLAVGAAMTFYRLSSNSLSLSGEPESLVTAASVPTIPRKGARRIALLCSPMGSTPLETLAPLSILNDVELVSYSEKTRRCRIAPGLSLIPHHALLDADLPQFDAWIVPPLAASDSPELWQKLISVLSHSPKLLVFGESARFAALALGQGGRPTQLAVPYSTQKEISKAFPEARWITGQRVVIHQTPRRLVVSSPGLAATPEATRAFVDALAQRKANAIPSTADAEPRQIARLSIPNLIQFIRWVGFQPRALRAEVILDDQVDEWGLAALLEVFGKSGAVRILYSSPTTIRTLHGYQLVVAAQQRSAPIQADLTVAPSTTHLNRAESSALELLYATVGKGSEDWIRILAARLMLRSPDFDALGAIPTYPGATLVFFFTWLAMTGFALFCAKLARQLISKSTRLHSNSPLFKKRRGKSK